MLNIYMARYIQTALTQNKIAPLDCNQLSTPQDVETMQSIQQASIAGGTEAVRIVWQMAKRLRPDIAHYDLCADISDLKHIVTPFYLLEDYPIYVNGFNALIGPSGGGKSFVAMDIAGLVSQDFPVIYVAGEGLSGYYGRHEAWRKHFGRPRGEFHIYKEAVQVINPDQRAQLIDWGMALKPALIVIDTMARSAVGIEENSAKEVGEFIAACDEIKAQTNSGILIVHHTGKDGKIRGSSALYAAADSVLSLSNTDGQITLSNNPDRGGKNKHQESAKDRHMKIIPVDVDDLRSAVIISGSIVEDSPSVNPLTNNQRQILEAIDGYESGITARQIIEMTGLPQATVYRNLKLLMKSDHIKVDRDLYCLSDVGVLEGYQ